jgi:hypothetical protein
MRATITEVHLHSDKRITVEFDSRFGSASGVWVNEELPVKGQDYDCEVDIFDQLHFGKEITLSQSEGFHIAKDNDNDNVIIQGLLEGSFEDNTICVRFGDTVILVESSGTPFTLNQYVQLRVKEIGLYDCNF